MPDRPKVAIACQGGGSHAAFAAGVLMGLLGPDQRDRFELVGLSGTSGGAMCAALAWAGLHCGGPDAAIARLSAFWDDLKVEHPLEMAMNAASLMAAQFNVEISPYLMPAPAEAVLRRWLKDHLRLEDLPQQLPAYPTLQVGATDVLAGTRVVFKDRQVSYDALVASAAVPFLYRAVPVEMKGGTSYMWDGLFSVNPPLRELIREPIDQIWVIQINPQAVASVPKSATHIVDRRNELSGNLSLAQELHFIQTINELLEAQKALGDGTLPLGDGKYRQVEIHLIEACEGSTSALCLEGLSYESKLDRSAGFIDDLMEEGRQAAPRLGTAASLWPRRGALTHETKVVE